MAREGKKTLRSGLGTKIFNIALILVPILLLGWLILFLIEIDRYNTTPRSVQLTEALYDGDMYRLGDVSVKISDRGGDAGSWMKDPIYDEAGNEVHGSFVGTIYEALIYNNSVDVVSDWTLRVPINEPMWLNNNWNSKMEIHQNVQGDEKVMAIDLADYSEYDIILDYYMDHTGPMIPLYVGDYFIYLPEKMAEEKPINPPVTGEPGEACARFGYIMYIPDKGLDYIADFSGGVLEYYMYANPITKPVFWVLAGGLFVWLVVLTITLIVRFKVRQMRLQQQREKEHDEMMVEQTMTLIINTIENKDPNTKGHSIRVAEYAKLIAERLGYSEEEAKNVFYIGLMHDCGKINIPDEILKNPGKLSDAEYEIMKKHTTYGGEILKNFTSIPEIAVGAKYHHERYDGKGYPTGLAGEDIPVIARIIGVADSFDAMNSKRCYRDKLPGEVILSELEKNRNKQFDSVMVDQLLGLIHEGKISIDSSDV